MKPVSMMWRALLACSTLVVSLVALPAGADMPAVNHDFIDRGALVEAAGELGSEEAERFGVALDAAGADRETPRLDLPGYVYAGAAGEVAHAILALIRPSLRTGYRADVDRFLRDISDRRLVRGLLRARNGGPYHIEWALEGDGRVLLIRRHIEAGGMVTFRRPFSLCDAPSGSATTAGPDGPRMTETDRDEAGRPRRQRTLACDESDGTWRADGPYAEWDQAGVKRVEGQYRTDRRDGPWQFRDEQGRITAAVRFTDGSAVEETRIDRDDQGRPRREETRRRLEDGSRVTETAEWDYHPNGQVRSERRFRDDYRHGTWLLRDEDGHTLERVEFRRGVAMPPVGETTGQDGLALRLFLKAAESDRFDPKALAPLARDLDDAGQQALASLAFGSLRRSDDNHPEIFERLYLTVIEYAPATDLAHQAYWRLANLYRQAYDPPRLANLAELMERFLARYRSSNVLSLEKHPDAPLVFSPLRALHQAYEELGRFAPIADYYRTRTARGLAMPAEDCWDYARALDKLGQAQEAVAWYERYLAQHPEADFSAQLARDRIEALRSPSLR